MIFCAVAVFFVFLLQIYLSPYGPSVLTKYHSCFVLKINSAGSASLIIYLLNASTGLSGVMHYLKEGVAESVLITNSCSSSSDDLLRDAQYLFFYDF